jgi:hypothetical protein
MLSYRYFPAYPEMTEIPCTTLVNLEFSQTGGSLSANYMDEVIHSTQSQQVSASLKVT